jgi:hypothetical protein
MIGQSALANTVADNIARSTQPVAPKDPALTCATYQKNRQASNSDSTGSTVLSTAVRIAEVAAVATALSSVGGHPDGSPQSPCSNPTARF